MSGEVKRDPRTILETALRDYIAEQTGGILIDWVVVSAATDIEDIGTGRATYSISYPSQQAPHATIGLLKYASDYIQIDFDE